MANIYLGNVPSLADLVEDPVVKESFYLDNLAVTGKLVHNHIQPTWDMAGLEDNVPQVAPRQESPQQGTKRA